MSKEIYIRKILKDYGLIVDFDGEPDRTNLPSPKAGETVKQWTTRVLGPNVSNVMVYMPIQPAPNKSVARLAVEAKSDGISKVFAAVNKKQKKHEAEAVKEGRQETYDRWSTFSGQDILDCLDECDLLPSVKQFYESYAQNLNGKPTNEVLKDIMRAHNAAVILANRSN